MSEFLVAVGLVLVIEGLIWAAVPGTAIAMLKAAAETPESTLRLAGAGAIAAGVFIVWLVRG
ncbi:MAG: DUF2065 family protein [Hyphomicrobiales bacterium]|nr:DUF2065 family protein [Hyphomicrobiales bacterium]